VSLLKTDVLPKKVIIKIKKFISKDKNEELLVSCFTMGEYWFAQFIDAGIRFQ
jgi:hypothetical protein